ncbi:MAG: TIGR04222 domain-containing membrane protein, partial [Cyanobacteriota bacterium]|nr:TIGR04222 domain-containing membrane protein [Cyanobacteriota bacterium]
QRRPIRRSCLAGPKWETTAQATGQILAGALALAVALALALPLTSTALAQGASSPGSPPSAGVAPVALAAAPALVWASHKVVRLRLRPPTPQPQEPDLDLEQLAYLARGATGALQVALAKLVQQGVVHPNPSENSLELVSFAPLPRAELERQLVSRLQQNSSPQQPLALNTSDLMALRYYNFKTLRHELLQRQLIVEPFSPLVSGGLGLAIVILYPLLFPFLWAGVIGLICGVLVSLELVAPSTRSRWGEVVLERYRRHVDHYDPLGRVALLGSSALSGGALDDLRMLIRPAAGQQGDGGGGCGC